MTEDDDGFTWESVQPEASDERETEEPEDDGSRPGTHGGDEPQDDAPLGDLAEEVQQRDSGGDGADGSGVEARSGPMADLAEEVQRRRAAADPDPDDAFDEVDVPEIDSQGLWESISAGEDTVAVSESDAGTGPAAADVEDDRDVQVISKRTCQRCRYFTAPPEVRCTHEGTEILELVGTDRHKVVDCPMVVEEEVGREGSVLDEVDAGADAEE